MIARLATPISIEQEKLVQVVAVTNNLPYSCIIEIKRSANIDGVHYAVLDSKNEKLFYKVAPTGNVLPSLSIHDFKETTDKEVTLAFWPVVDGVEGEPVYYGPIILDNGRKLGTYDLEVDLKGEDLKQFQLIKPLIEKYYGKAALPGLVRLQPHTHDVYFPSTNTIYLSPSKHNFIHELLHANRKQLLFASKKYQFDQGTEILEEFFSEGVSNLIKDELADNGLVYGSTHGYNYDFRIQDNALITQDLQSTIGGILVLEHARYFLASEAYHKIALEYQIKTGRFFGKDFNAKYYGLMQEGLVDPDREMFFSICEQLMPTIEGTDCRQWMSNQKLFYCINIPGEKLFMDIRDYYTTTDWAGIGRIYFYETFANGSDWRDGNKLYSKNKEEVTVRVVRMSDGKVFYNKTHQIDGNKRGFGEIKVYFSSKEESTLITHFKSQDKMIKSGVAEIENGVYEIILTTATTEKRYFRILGNVLVKDRNKLLFATPLSGVNTTVQVTHTNAKGVETVLAAQPFNKHRLCVVAAPFIKDKNCEPGMLQITIDDGVFQKTLHRTIGYGGDYGGHQFWLGELTSTDFI